MGAPKGNTYATRKRGVPNKRTQNWDQFASWMMSDGVEKFHAEMAKLEGKDFIRFIIDLMEFFKPKLARTELTGKDGKSIKFKDESEIKKMSPQEKTIYIMQILGSSK